MVRKPTPPNQSATREGSVKPLTKPTVKKTGTSAGVQARAKNRLGRLVERGGTVPAGVKAGHPVSIQQAKAIKAALLALNAKNRAATGTAKTAPGATPSTPATPKDAPFDPLQPLAGKAFDDEVAAASRKQFGDADLAIKNAYTNNQQGAELSDSYYDNYKKELAASAERLRAENDKQTAASQAQVDKSFTEDDASAKAREAAASDKAGQLGLSGTMGGEGVQRAAAARSQGNQTVANDRAQSSSSNTLMENRGASAVQAKAEALTRSLANKSKIGAQATKLAGDKGDFNTNYRAKAREAERNWAAVQSEFNLKSKVADADISAKTDANGIEKQKLASQQIVAKIYAAADATKAKAQVRVAKLQLEKGKISQRQYREITNIYKGLPKKGKPTPAKSTAPTSKAGGSGPGGTLAPWEVDDQARAANGFKTNKYTAADRNRAIAKAIQAGIPARLARAAWAKYEKTLHRGTNAAPDGKGGSRPN